MPDQGLIEHIFNTIELGHMIVCRPTASPHNSVHVSDARRRLLRVPRDAVNQCVAAHDPASHRCMFGRNGPPFLAQNLATTAEEYVGTLANYCVET